MVDGVDKGTVFLGPVQRCLSARAVRWHLHPHIQHHLWDRITATHTPPRQHGASGTLHSTDLVLVDPEAAEHVPESQQRERDSCQSVTLAKACDDDLSQQAQRRISDDNSSDDRSTRDGRTLPACFSRMLDATRAASSDSIALRNEAASTPTCDTATITSLQGQARSKGHENESDSEELQCAETEIYTNGNSSLLQRERYSTKQAACAAHRNCAGNARASRLTGRGIARLVGRPRVTESSSPRCACTTA